MLRQMLMQIMTMITRLSFSNLRRNVAIVVSFSIKLLSTSLKVNKKGREILLQESLVKFKLNICEYSKEMEMIPEMQSMEG
jgi:hypothetical protein